MCLLAYLIFFSLCLSLSPSPPPPLSLSLSAIFPLSPFLLTDLEVVFVEVASHARVEGAEHEAEDLAAAEHAEEAHHLHAIRPVQSHPVPTITR